MYLSPTGGAHHLAAGRLDHRLETTVREDRDDDPTRQRPATQPIEREDAEDLVSVDDLAGRIHRDQSVGIAVEREADPGASDDHCLGQRGGVHGTRSDIDVDAVRLGVDDLDLRPARSQDLRPERRAGAVGGVEDEMRVGRAHARCERQPMTEVVVDEIGSRDDPAHTGIRRAAEVVGPPDELFELVLDRIVELEAGPVEHFQPIVVGRVVGGRDHDPGRERAAPREIRERRRRDDPDDLDLGAETAGAGRDGGHEHVARAPRVLAHDQGPTRPDQAVGGRPTEAVGESRFQVDVRDTADPVGAEQAGHGRLSRSEMLTARRRPVAARPKSRPMVAARSP